MSQPLTPETLHRARDLREMGATWARIVLLTGIPQIVLREALHVTSWPATVTRVEANGTTAIVRAIRTAPP